LVLVVTNFMDKTRVVVKQEVPEYAPFNLSHYTSLQTHGKNHLYMFYTHMCPSVIELQKKKLVGLYPTLLPHNGSVIVIFATRDLRNSWEPPDLIRRMVWANIYKTHFPFSRAPFYLVDKKYFNYESVLFKNFITITCQVAPTMTIREINLMIQIHVADDKVETNYEYKGGDLKLLDGAPPAVAIAPLPAPVAIAHDPVPGPAPAAAPQQQQAPPPQQNNGGVAADYDIDLEGEFQT